MDRGYKAELEYVSKEELSPIEKVKLLDVSDAHSLDELVKRNTTVEINFDYYAKINIHNEHSNGDKDYVKYIVVDKDGNKFVSGSQSLMNSLEDIIDNLSSLGCTEFRLKVYSKPSKNYSGNFLTCSIA